MGKYFNIIEAMFKTAGLAKDTGLLTLAAASIILPVAIFLALTFLLKGIGFILAIPIVVVVAWYFSLKKHNRVMELQGIEKGQLIKFTDWAWLNFRRIFVDLFCWYDKKLLIPVIVAIILVAIGVVLFGSSMPAASHTNEVNDYMYANGASARAHVNSWSALQALGGLGMVIIGLYLVVIVWMIVFYIHSTRTKFGSWLALAGVCAAGEALKQSNAQIKGQTLEAALPSYINLQLVYLAAYIVLIPIEVVFVVLMLLGGSTSILGTAIMLIATLVIALILMAETMIIEAGIYKFWIVPEEKIMGKVDLKKLAPRPVA